MGLFGFGKKEETLHITEHIMYNNLGGELIVRHHCENFNNKTTLTVQPGQVALFVHNGIIEASFTEGMYQLNTENYPFLEKLLNKLTGKKRIFTSTIYFVHTAESLQIDWGTDKPIKVNAGIEAALQVSARGTYKIRIGDASVFLKKVGGASISTFKIGDMRPRFGSEILKHINTNIATYLNNCGEKLIAVAQHQADIEEAVTPKIKAFLEEVGIELVKFNIESIELTGADYEKLNTDRIKRASEREQTENEAYIDVTKAKGKAEAFKTLNSELDSEESRRNWMMMEQMKVMQTMAEKGQGSGVASAATDMGMGMATGMAFMNMTQQMMNPMQQQMNVQQQSMQTPPPPPVSQWYVFIGGQQCGPLNIQQVQQYVMQGQLKLNDLVWKAGMPSWLAASNVPEIAALFAQVPPTPPVPPVPPVPPTVG